jgi:hypothetical protein
VLRKKLLMVFGLASTLAFSVALATDKAAEPAQDAKEAQKAAIHGEGKADCHKAEGQCLRKKSGAANAQPSDDQNVASSGIDCPKSADCPKADCDKSHCLKSHGKAKAKAEAKPADEACDKPGAETEI